MAHSDFRDLYLQHGCCMAYVAIEKNGEPGIGSAFHIGEGIFVTARHVLENATITEVRVTNPRLFYRSSLYPKGKDGSYTITKESQQVTLDFDGAMTLTGGPYFHPEASVDVAAFRVDGMAPGAPYVTLGGHYDDWIGEGDFETTDVLLLGYPPIPFTTAPILIAAKAQVNAVVDLRSTKSPVHFILLAIPRGGFSGGVAISEYGFALGVITQSLLGDNLPAELGYFATTSIEAIYECLDHHQILPKFQKIDHAAASENASSE
ncbi:MAG TPA: serine protease [Pirellulales bacterium]|jgi:hypothetical protein